MFLGCVMRRQVLYSMYAMKVPTCYIFTGPDLKGMTSRTFPSRAAMRAWVNQKVHSS